MKKIFVLMLVLPMLALQSVAAKSYSLKSPNGVLEVKVEAAAQTYYTLTVDGVEVIAPSRIAMEMESGVVLGDNVRVRKVSQGSCKEHIVAPLYRQAEFDAEYNYLTILSRDGYSLELRAYNDGVAYRFVTAKKEELTIRNEVVEFNFAEDYNLVIPYADKRNDPYYTSFESQYTLEKVSDVKSHTDRLAFMPVMVDIAERGKLLLTEADVEDYPGLFVTFAEEKVGLKAFPTPLPSEWKITGSGSKRPTAYHDIVAKTKGCRTFPWRVVGYAADDTQLPVNNMVYQLAAPSRIEDTSWIKGGKSTWDWWNGVRLYGVDFRAGINTETYKYHIDFAAKYGIEYVMLDDGWYPFHKRNLLEPYESMNIPELVKYADERGVKLLLWAVGQTLLEQAEEACEHYSKMGIAGFKVDFFDAQDQLLVQDIYRLSEVTAKHKLLIDFHGMYKPTGLSRTYPNVINYEGVFGLEQMKWTDRDRADMPLNDVLIPYIRMAAGPMDYTQGAMLNAAKGDFRSIDKRPMSQGTRAHQVAMYVVYDSPFVMLCDTPSNYLREDETTRYIASIPTVFTSSKVLSGKVGEHIVMAREKDGVWYVGALTSWEPREVEVDFSFLAEGEWEVALFRDGINADLTGLDYKTENLTVKAGDKQSVKMAPGGGFAMIIKRK
ncbi:MAG: glycoside hydrolase family 97 protein [Alistipes sp.]|nr:glycoside hydrolase family 97 protein [Alistipes sp.]